MNLKNSFKLMACIAIPLIVGAVSGIATSSNIKTWYVYLNKPSFNPPNWVFAPAWTILYILMGISLFLITQAKSSHIKSKALYLFFMQLFLNFAWSFIFFYFHQVGWALVEIAFLWISIILMIRQFYKINSWSGYLQIPYLLWVSFASILNASIWYLNS
jgi:tryptophan-rich sensory protein